MAKKSRPTPARKPQAPPPTRQQAPAPARKTPPRPSTAATPASRWEPAGWWRLALAVTAIAFVCYLPSLSNGFVNWDDDVNLTKNPNLEVVNAESLRNIFSLDKGPVIGNYNPLPIFSFALEKWAVGKIDPWVVHFNNALLHAITVFFAFRLLLHLGFGMGGAVVGGLLFAIHPMRVESVAWATERKDVLFAVFFFAALMYYVRWVGTEDGSKRLRLYILMLALALLSCFSKVQAVTLPLSMLVIDYWLRRPLTLKLIWEKTPFWLLSMAFGLINLYTLKQQGSTVDEHGYFTFADRLCIGAYSFLVYLYKVVIPYPMSPLYPYPKPLPIYIYLSPIGFAAVWYLIWRAWRADNRIWVFGMFFFFFNVMFLLQVLGAGQGFLADRFTYVPYFGLFAVGAWYYTRFAADDAKRNALNIGLGVLFLVYALYTYRQIGIWKNGYTLWTHVIKFEDNTPNELPYWNRAQYLRDNGQFDESMQDFNKAITLKPANPELYNSRGKAFFDAAMSGKAGNQQRDYVIKALEDYTKGISLDNVKPGTKAEMLINRGAAHASVGIYDKALDDLNKGLEIEPDNKNGYFNRSLVYYSTQQYDNAVADYTEYLKYDPLNANVWYERGMIRRAQNKNDEAVADLTRALQLNPNLGIAYLERARANAQAGNKAAAQQDYQRAKQMGAALSPRDVEMMQ
ncbi:MAG: tetratricopeptide repeat protein [Saprospiraceae bacterium]|nr:tetratricopeptide repeat protein [Saprospiraceae bacterium]